MKPKHYLAAASMLLALIPPAKAVDTVFTGTLTNEQTYIRPELPLPYNNTYLVRDWKAGDTSYNYLTRTFIPGGSGTYAITVTDTEIGDPMLFVYSPTFDSSSPLTNGLIANDDIAVQTGDLRARINGAELIGGQTYIIVVTSFQPGLTGNFTFVISGDYGARLVHLTTLSTDLSLSTGQVLDGICGGDASTEMKDTVNRLLMMSDGKISTIMPRLTPQTGLALRELAFGNFDIVSDAVDARLGTISSDTTVDGAATPAPRENLWIKGLGRFSHHEARAGYVGYHINGGGIAVGGDHAIQKDWIIGGALSFAEAKASFRDYRNGDTLQDKTYQATLYTLKDFGRWFVQGSLAGALHDFDSKRDTQLTGIAQGNFHGRQLGSQIKAGMPFKFGRFTATPSAAFNCSRLWTNAYTESEAGSMSLIVHATNQTKAQTALGGRISTDLSYAGMTIRPFAQAYWLHQFNSSTCDVTAEFFGGGGEFITSGQHLLRNSAKGGLGVNVSKGAFYGELSYDTEIACASTKHIVQAFAGLRF